MARPYGTCYRVFFGLESITKRMEEVRSVKRKRERERTGINLEERPDKSGLEKETTLGGRGGN